MMKTYELWVVVNNQDTWVTIQAISQGHAENIARQMYGNCRGCRTVG